MRNSAVIILLLTLFSNFVYAVRVHEQVDIHILYPDPNYKINAYLNTTTDEIVLNILTKDNTLYIHDLDHKILEAVPLKEIQATKREFEIRYPTKRKALAEKISDSGYNKKTLRIGETSTIIIYEDNTENWWNQDYEYRTNITAHKSASSTYIKSEVAQTWVLFPSGYESAINALQLVDANNSTIDFYRWHSTNNTTHLSKTRLIFNVSLSPNESIIHNLYWSKNPSVATYNDTKPNFIFLGFNYQHDVAWWDKSTDASLIGGTLQLTSDNAHVSKDFNGILDNDNDFFITTVFSLEGDENPGISYQIQDADGLHEWSNNFRFGFSAEQEDLRIDDTVTHDTAVVSPDIVASTDYFLYMEANKTDGWWTAYIDMRGASNGFLSLADLIDANKTWFVISSYGASLTSSTKFWCFNCYYNESDTISVSPEPSLNEWGVHWWGGRGNGSSTVKLNYLRFSDIDEFKPTGSQYPSDILAETGEIADSYLPDVAYMPNELRLVAVVVDASGRNVSIYKSENAGLSWTYENDIQTMQDTEQDMTSIVVAPAPWTNISLIIYSADRESTGQNKTVDGRKIWNTCSGNEGQGLGYFLYNFSSGDIIYDLNGSGKDIFSCSGNLTTLSSLFNYSRLDLIPTESKEGYTYFLTSALETTGHVFQTNTNFLKLIDSFVILDNYKFLNSGQGSSVIIEPEIGRDPIFDNLLTVTWTDTETAYYNLSIEGEWTAGGTQTITKTNESTPHKWFWNTMMLRAPNSSTVWNYYSFYNDTDNNFLLGSGASSSIQSAVLTEIWNTTTKVTGQAKAELYPGITPIFISDDLYITYLQVPTFTIFSPNSSTNLTNENLVMNFTIDFTHSGTCEGRVFNNSSGEEITNFVGLNPDIETESDFFRYGTNKNGFYYIVFKCFHPAMEKYVNASSQVFEIANLPLPASGTIHEPAFNSAFLNTQLIPVKHTAVGDIIACSWELNRTYDSGVSEFRNQSMFHDGQCINASNIVPYLDKLDGIFNYTLAVIYINGTGERQEAIAQGTSNPYTKFTIDWVFDITDISTNFSCEGYLYKRRQYLWNTKSTPGLNTILTIFIPERLSFQNCNDIKITNYSYWGSYNFNEEFTVDGTTRLCANTTGCSFSEQNPIISRSLPIFASRKLSAFNTCEVLINVNISPSAYIKIDILSGFMGNNSTNRLDDFNSIFNISTYQTEFRLRTVNPFLTSKCELTQALSLFVDELTGQIWDILLNDEISITADIDTLNGNDLTYILSSLTPMNVTLSTGETCTDVTRCEATISGPGIFEVFANITLASITGLDPITIRNALFNVVISDTLNASLPRIIEQPATFSNETYTMPSISVSAIRNLTNCYVSFSDQNQWFGQGIGVPADTFTWTANISNGAVSYYDLFFPFLSVLAWKELLERGTATYTFSPTYWIVCSNNYSKPQEITTLFDTSKITGVLADSCESNGDYGGCIEFIEGIETRSFWIKNRNQEFSNWAIGALWWTSQPMNLVDWISKPSNFMLTLIIILIFAPIMIGIARLIL